MPCHNVARHSRNGEQHAVGAEPRVSHPRCTPVHGCAGRLHCGTRANANTRAQDRTAQVSGMQWSRMQQCTPLIIDGLAARLLCGTAHRGGAAAQRSGAAQMAHSPGHIDGGAVCGCAELTREVVEERRVRARVRASVDGLFVAVIL